ncbi:MAG: hypothetical protein ACKVOM_08265 [Ferruginibacter sp.]
MKINQTTQDKKLLICLFLAPSFLFAQQKVTVTLCSKFLMVKRFMEINHYKPLQWNDSASQLLYIKWLETIDEERLFLIQEDIARLDAYKNKLDDEMNGTDWAFFDTSTNLLVIGIKKADSIVNTFLTQPIDFSNPDIAEWPCKTYAASEQDFAKRWHRYLKWHLLTKISIVHSIFFLVGTFFIKITVAMHSFFYLAAYHENN